MDNSHKDMSEVEYIIMRLDMIAGKAIRIEELFSLLFTDVIEMKTISATMLEFMEINGDEYKVKYAGIYDHLLKRSQERITKFYDDGKLSNEHQQQLILHTQMQPTMRVLA